MKPILLLLWLMVCSMANAQTNILSTNPVAEQVMLGQYNPATYQAPASITKAQLVQGLWSNLSTDSMFVYLQKLASFQNRNTGSDTVSPARGVGAARRWIHDKFTQFSAASQNRLIPSYLQFDKNICGVTQHRNIFCVLPGTDTSDKSVIIVEGHMDSRCEDECDTACLAQGMEDNASGTALVMELARVMSRYAFNNTIVFIATIGEEQGLDGAGAFALYCKQKNIAVKAVLNNDVIGGIICGKTASPPGCVMENTIDSTSVRIFSSGTNISPHKGLARFAKLEFIEEAQAVLDVPFTIYIMNAEDRTGRGGDHIPFRQQGYTSVRFTSTNEHGDAQIHPGYQDRQHTSRDILGKDTDSNGSIDSMYVNLNYLKRNCMVNANAIAMAANGPAKAPDFTLVNDGNGITVNITPVPGIITYRVGLRAQANDFSELATVSGSLSHHFFNIKTDSVYFVSVASVDAGGTESLFSTEKYVRAEPQPNTGLVKTYAHTGLTLMPAMPNPFDETTTISVLAEHVPTHSSASIRVTDITGRIVKDMPLQLQPGINEVLYEHGFNRKGLLFYALILDGKSISSGKMLFR